jgi:hypothetical protein
MQFIEKETGGGLCGGGKLYRGYQCVGKEKNGAPPLDREATAEKEYVMTDAGKQMVAGLKRMGEI